MPKQPIKDDIKADVFADAFLKNGLNATKAYEIISPDVTKQSAGELGHRQLKRVEVQRSIAERLPSDVVLSREIKRAISAETPKNIDWKGKHRFIETALKLKGYLNDKPQSNVNVALVIRK